METAQNQIQEKSSTVGNIESPTPFRIGGRRWFKVSKSPASWSKVVREIKRHLWVPLYAPFDIHYNRLPKLRQAEKEFPTILSLNKTVDLLISGASICRFGDGEFNCLHWQHSSDAQAKVFARRLEEVLATPSSEQLVIAAPQFNCPHNTSRRKYGWLNFWEDYWSRHWDFLRGKLMNRTFGNTDVSRVSVFYDVEVEKIRSIWAGRDVVFVTGKNSRFFDDPRLFDNMKSVEYMFVESVDAWRNYDEALEQALTFDKSKLFIICAGFMATVLAFDLHHHGYHALDMGHLPNCYAEYLKEAPKPEWLPRTIVRKWAA